MAMGTTISGFANRSFSRSTYDQIDAIRGMDITITTSARDDKAGKALLEALRFSLSTKQTTSQQVFKIYVGIDDQPQGTAFPKRAKRYAAKRAKLREIIREPKSSDTAREEAQALVILRRAILNAAGLRNRCDGQPQEYLQTKRNFYLKLFPFMKSHSMAFASENRNPKSCAGQDLERKNINAWRFDRGLCDSHARRWTVIRQDRSSDAFIQAQDCHSAGPEG